MLRGCGFANDSSQNPQWKCFSTCGLSLKKHILTYSTCAKPKYLWARIVHNFSWKCVHNSS